MMPHLTLRYDLRVPSLATTTHGTQYAACLEQCAWADDHGFDTVVLSEHHGVEDGYLPAPVVLAGAVAGRTRRMRINISALLLPLHDPIRLAEQLAVLDLACAGRTSLVAGLGYRQEEFEMAGVDRRDRGRLLEEYVEVMRRAWTGEPFEWQGRRITVTPRPATQPHPIILVGGSTEVAARRAARLKLPFMPAIRDDALAEAYHAACKEVGFAGGWVLMPAGPGFLHVSEDPERDWDRIAPYALYEAQTYHAWQTPGQRSQTDVDATTLDELKRSEAYRVVTPDECVALAEEAGTLVFHPLMGGMPPELGWESLELFATKVVPRLRPEA
jgi:alkanesulfonate monooxygenase SsuD/methylene tetrahydromethanopterin reductase-like flavin-dependent oxidoreductase (luciferase family)